MSESWLPLHCGACEHRWQDDVAELPGPDATLECPDCGQRDRTTAFMETEEAIQILRAFHR